ncbi:MAG: M48 family metallopeptidase [Hyphomicrobiaceae bacterium]|nr:M48 family metallopeptidase [Hyphomicrobiaceae bacterium]
MREASSSRKRAMQQLHLHGVSATVEVRRHPAARRMTLRVSRTRRTVIVTLPMQCDLEQAGQFVSRHIDWVKARLGSLPEPVPFQDGAVVPLRGAPHTICFLGQLQRGAVVAVESTADEERRLVVSGDRTHAPRRLLDWLMAQARADLDERVRWHAANLDLRPRGIAVRDQISRWGSCSTTRMLSFSWRLVIAPPLILDYVAAHEVAHLAEMNHSSRFWGLVRKTMPRMDEAKRWLQIYGMDLHRFGSEA